MAPEWLWVGAAIAGYVLVMVCNPLRSFFGEAYDFLRGRGQGRLWLPLAFFSLIPVSFSWFAAIETYDRADTSLLKASAADGAAMFTSMAGLRASDAAADLPSKTKAALSIGSVFWAAWMTGLQFFVLTALYLRAVMPERDPGWKGLIDFAWRRSVRFWPGILFAGGASAIAVWLAPDGNVATVWWCVVAVVTAVFAFLQLSLLSGDRGFREAVGSNFECWKRLPYETVWFLIVVAIHVFLLRVSDRSASGWISGRPALAISWDVFFALVRTLVMVWLAAAWILFFCAKTKNSSRRRIRP